MKFTSKCSAYLAVQAYMAGFLTADACISVDLSTSTH